MELATLINALQDPNPNFRLMTARVLGMVEEVSALEAIGTASFAENDADVRETLRWAGKRITDAKQRGYNILEDIFVHFRIQQEIESLPDPNEQKLMRQMQDNMERELLASKEKSMRGNLGMAVVAGAAIGGLAGAAMGAMGALVSAGSSGLSDGSDTVRPRIFALIPTSTDIQGRVKHLQYETSSYAKAMLLREIRDTNNPEALPVFATLYLLEPDSDLQQLAYECGRELYLRVRYWQFQQDGTIDEEYKRRAAALNKAVGRTELVSEDKPNTTRDATPEEIAAILARADERRAARKKK